MVGNAGLHAWQVELKLARKRAQAGKQTPKERGGGTGVGSFPSYLHLFLYSPQELDLPAAQASQAAAHVQLVDQTGAKPRN